MSALGQQMNMSFALSVVNLEELIKATCIPLVDCPVCLAPPRLIQRVRKNILSLSTTEWSKVVEAVWKMKLRKTGKSYDYFVTKHSAAKYDSRYDQGHFGAHFATWHTLFVLEFENELLKIDPTIKALPYWDFTTIGSFNSLTALFSAKYFGSRPGSNKATYEVTDGMFGHFPIGDMNPTIWASYEKYRTGPSPDGSYLEFNGTTASGKLRGRLNKNTNDYPTRFPAWYYDPAHGTCKSAEQYFRTHPFNSTISMCTGSDILPWMFWFICMDTEITFTPPFAETDYLAPHSTPHMFIGSVKPCGALDGPDDGDFKDMYTSPNEPLFMFHHNNMIRSNFGWMSTHSNNASVYYGYPKYGATVTLDGITLLKEGQNLGIGLHDAVSSNWGYTDEDLGVYVHNDSKTLWTHADVLCQLSPTASPYTFDEFPSTGPNAINKFVASVLAGLP